MAPLFAPLIIARFHNLFPLLTVVKGKFFLPPFFILPNLTQKFVTKSFTVYHKQNILSNFIDQEDTDKYQTGFCTYHKLHEQSLVFEDRTDSYFFLDRTWKPACYCHLLRIPASACLYQISLKYKTLTIQPYFLCTKTLLRKNSTRTKLTLWWLQIISYNSNIKKLKLLPNFFIEILLSYWCSIPLLSHANNMKLIMHIIHSK